MEQRLKYRWLQKPLPLEDAQKLLTVPGRDGLIFAIALYTGLRNAPIRHLQWRDVIDNRLQAKANLVIVDTKQSALQKKRIVHDIKLVSPLRKQIKQFYDDCGCPALSRFLFYPDRHVDLNKPITGEGVNLRLKYWAAKLRLTNRNITMHSLRKTMFEAYFKRNGMLKTLGYTKHATPSELLTYLGYTPDVVNDGVVDFYSGEDLSLKEKMERGMIDINIEALIQDEEPNIWPDLLFQELAKHHNDHPEIYEAVNWLLMPYRISLKLNGF